MIKRYAILLALLGCLNLVAAQTAYKKVGLCLSGGGAKGLAHIGLLKLIDSLGIKIDYITGTSMGSVVGALYASGYTGKQIDSIARGAEWERLLSRYVPMSEIFIDEKDEYMRYVAEIPLEKGKPNFTGLIDGQELLNLFARLTLPVAHIKDFNQLPIPYHCMAVDVVKVEAVEISSGNLALAMRASMSIPTIFKPVKIDNHLLIDGGVLENFPVEQLKKMGAEFVIGSYTGGRLYTEEELKTLDKILVQTSLYTSIEKAAKLEKLCHIMNNLTKGMGSLSAGSFNKSLAILDSGDAISAACIPQLLLLDAMQQQEGRMGNPKAPLNFLPDTLLLNQLSVAEAQKSYTADFAKSRISQSMGAETTADRLERAVRNLYGSRNYNSVYYDLMPNEGKVDAVFHAPEDYSLRVKPAIHYDNERGAGIILNATLRNVLGAKSRFLVTADLAEAPKLRIHYRRYFAHSAWSLNALVFGEIAEQRLYEDRTGKTSDIYRNNFASAVLGVSYAINHAALFSLGITSEVATLKPRLENEITVHSRIEQLGLLASLQYNTLDQPYFPQQGWDVFVSSKLPYFAQQELRLTVTSTDTLGNVSQRKSEGNITSQPYSKNNIRVVYNQPLSNKLTLQLGCFQGLTFQNIFGRNSDIIIEDSYLTKAVPVNDYFFIGGTDQRSRPYLIGLAGLRDGELLTENFNIIKLGLQYEPMPKTFLTTFAQYYTSASSPKSLYTNLTDLDISFDNKKDENGGEYASLLSYCLSLGYRSALGPVSLTLSKASFLPVYRLYFSFGFKF